MIYSSEASDRSVGGNLPTPGAGHYQHEASDLNPGCVNEVLHHLPEEEKHIGRKTIKVLEVLTIMYPEGALNSSQLEVEYELDGRLRRGIFKYEDIKGLDGTQSALEKFGPTFE